MGKKMNFIFATFFGYIFVLTCFLKSVSSAEFNLNRHHKAPMNRTVPQNEGYCQKLYDRVVGLSTLDEQQIRQLETIESRLTRIEAISQERAEAMGNELKEINKRTQNLDWINTKSDTALEHIRGEIESIRNNIDQSQFRQIRANSNGNDAGLGTNITQMLSSLALFLASVREGVFNAENSLKALQTNVTTLLQISRDLQKRQHAQPTKQYINRAITQLSGRGTEHGLITNNYRKGSSSIAEQSNCIDEHIKENQINLINQNPIGSFYVKCFSNEDYGRGWTTVLNRFDGSINFYRHFLDYKNGFGNIAGEFFIGLDKLHALTSNRLHELLVLLQDFDGEARFAKYNAFAIAGPKEDYALSVLGDYDGTAGDSLTYSASYKFSTFDNDNDGWVEGNCAKSHTGAWWYNACEMTNLMGQYLSIPVESQNKFQGMYWNSFQGSNYSLFAVRMLIRPLDFTNDDE